MDVPRTDEYEKWEDFLDRNFQTNGFFFRTEVIVHREEEKDDEEIEEYMLDSVQFSDDEEELTQRYESLKHFKRSICYDLRQAKGKLRKASHRHDHMESEQIREEIRVMKSEKECIKKILSKVKEKKKSAKRKAKSSATAHDTTPAAGELPPPPHSKGIIGRIGSLFVQRAGCV